MCLIGRDRQNKKLNNYEMPIFVEEEGEGEQKTESAYLISFNNLPVRSLELGGTEHEFFGMKRNLFRFIVCEILPG